MTKMTRLLRKNELAHVAAGNLEIGYTTTVYFDTVEDKKIIGWTTTLTGWDLQPLDCLYRSHYNEWTLPIYTVGPIYTP